MILKLFLFLCTLLTLTKGDNTTCPTTTTRRNTIQCFTYPKSTCVTELGVYSNTTSLFLGNSTVVNIETELRLFEVLFRMLSNYTDTDESCQRFYQTLACLHLYTPCNEGRPLRFCDEVCVLIQNSRCPIDLNFFLAFMDAGEVLFQELIIPTCVTINMRVDSYPQISNINYTQQSNCTYVGLPGAINGGVSGEVKLVTDDTHDSANIYATSAHGVLQVLNSDANIWGDVCIAKGTSNEDIGNIAQVACNSIGFPAATSEFELGPPSNASGYYMIDQIRCNGNESRLSECVHNGYDFKFCAPNRRLHVTCNKEVGTVVLGDEVKNNANSITGFPMIKLNGFVAEFCADMFNDSTGQIICRHINSSFTNTSYTSEPNTNNSSLTTYICQGMESRVLQCIPINEVCSSNRRVRLTCSNEPPPGNHTQQNTSEIVLTPINIIIIVASVIIFILLLVIVSVLCVFCSYRKETMKKLQESETRASSASVIYMRHVNREDNSIPRIVNNDVSQSYYITRPIIVTPETNQRQYSPIHTDEFSSQQIPGSPIQNYMVTTLGTDSLPLADQMLSINFLQDYCGADIKEYVIPGARLEMGNKLGEGAFGLVYKGIILDRFEGECDKVEPHNEVAVKTLKDPGNDHELKDLLIECALLKDLQHTNILGLLAVTYFGNRPYLIIPYMANGDLKGYLKSVRETALNTQELPEELSEKLLATMCLDIARGIEYLTKKRYVHRDLAARNCMVDSNFLIKVSDFGLSRELYVDDYYRHKGGKLPAKWMSPECLGDGISNEKTDVWSMGVTLWEVYSLGRNPYPGVGNSEMLTFLEAGKRMEKPRLCPTDMYELMQYCWQNKPAERPTFTIVTNYLESLECNQVECPMVTRVAIQEEEDKLHGIEYTEDSPSRKLLYRQDALSSTPFTPSQPICFEHLASRIEESTRKAFLMQCMKSVSMDSSRFGPSEHYTIPHLSISIPILDEEHRQRTRSLTTVRTKHASIHSEKSKRHTMAAINRGLSQEEVLPIPKTNSEPKSILKVPPVRRKWSNSARDRWRKSSRSGKHAFFSRSS